MARKWVKEGGQPRRQLTRKQPGLPARNSASDSMLIFPVFLPQKGCPFKCVYCDQTSFGSVQETPAELLSAQIKSFCTKHKNREKQIAFYGGTFTGLTPETRERYYDLVKQFLDAKTTLRISTRPDMVGNAELEWCTIHQIRTIELGIQDFNDEVLHASERGYNSQTAIDACLRVKEQGFETGIQLMPGLPGFSAVTHQATIRILRQIRVDLVRIYPLVILKGTPLWEKWQAGEVKLLTLDETINFCLDYYEWAAANQVKIIKIGIPSLEHGAEYAGPYHTALGELVKGERLIRKIVTRYSPGMKIHISNRDISLLTGHKDYNLRKLEQRLNQKSVILVPDFNLNQGEIDLSTD